MTMERAPGSTHLSYTMAAVVAVGGISGYLKTRSTPSLVAGLAIGSAFAYSGMLIQVEGADQTALSCPVLSNPV
jgi:uncharacterized membrane protein (UPF0136 family)